MPIAHAANPASDGASGSASAGAHASGERRPVLQEQAARRESSYAAPLEASEWVGEPVSIPRAAPEAHDFVPLRLTDGRPAPSKAENASEAAPETASDPAASTPGKTVTLFPDDSSLLGFVLSGPSAGASSAATPEAKRPKTVAGSTFSPVPTAPPSAHEKQESPSASAVEHIRPLIPGLLASLDEGMTEVRRGFSKSDTAEVEEAAARIAAKADNYGQRILARMARCVEMAARARDKDAIANILPELETAVERNRIALTPKTAA